MEELKANKTHYLSYNERPSTYLSLDQFSIPSFLDGAEQNIDQKTIESFGEEWLKFDKFDKDQLKKAAEEYFDILPSDILNSKSIVLDVGCGTGRWSKYLADKVGFVEAIDPSKAVFAAARYLEENKNVRISQAGVDNIPFEDESFDMVMSIGVLHHIPNTFDGIINCVKKVKKGGYFYTYLYYKLESKPSWYKFLHTVSNVMRLGIAKLPHFMKKVICDFIAFTIYIPFVGLNLIVKALFGEVYRKLPLSYYVGKSLNIVRNDALDRFGTPLEYRYSKDEIRRMLEKCGLTEIVFSDYEPFWHVIAKKN